MDLEKHFLEFNEQAKWDEKYKGWREPQGYTEIMAKYPDLRPANQVWLPVLDQIRKFSELHIPNYLYH